MKADLDDLGTDKRDLREMQCEVDSNGSEEEYGKGPIKLTKKLHGLSPQANYTERPPLVGEVSANFCG
jgi:hypothetical protein